MLYLELDYCIFNRVFFLFIREFKYNVYQIFNGVIFKIMILYKIKKIKRIQILYEEVH